MAYKTPMIDPDITIRIAQPADGAALMQVMEQINHETEFLGKPEERMSWADRAGDALKEMAERGSSVYFLALRRERPIGFLGAFGGWLARNRGNVFIGHVGLLEAERGRGVGGLLFEANERWARERGAHRLELRVDEKNARGQALYRRQGFGIEGRIAQACELSDGWHAHYWMAKPLQPIAAQTWQAVDFAPPERRIDPSPLVFRDVTAADAAAMIAWERQLLTDVPTWLKQPDEVSDAQKTVHWIGEGLKHGNLMHAALLGSRILGYIGAWRQPGLRMRHDGFFTLGVVREGWGVGIGRRLAAGVLDWAREQQLGRLSTATMAHNTRGLRFAERHGFAREVLSPGYTVIDGRAADRVQFGRVLGAAPGIA
jgi:RimJ/RimL family protein N-acetyltransferase